MTKRRRSDTIDMEAFYASLQEDQDTKAINDASSTVKKVMQCLRICISKKFSLWLYPGNSRVLKNALKLLLSLPPEKYVFSMSTKSAMLQLSQSFSQWYLDYDNARLKLDTATAKLSKAEKMKGDLEANVQDFLEMDKEDKSLSHELAQLQKEKRDLEDRISAVKTKIASRAATRDNVAKKKVKLFHKGRVVKAELDDLRNQAPRLKAELEWAKITQANIELEWSKLGAQFNKCVDLEKWI